jgi:hypothetical protein
MKKTPIIAAFCGTGKTYTCQESAGRLIEFECWKYSNRPGFPHSVVKHIISKCGTVDGIFISTNPMVLNVLPSKMDVTLVYPELSLKDEYIARFVGRDSSDDFISMLSKYWRLWIVEVMARPGEHHIVLKSGEYVESVLPKLLTTNCED